MKKLIKTHVFRRMVFVATWFTVDIAEYQLRTNLSCNLSQSQRGLKRRRLKKDSVRVQGPPIKESRSGPQLRAAPLRLCPIRLQLGGGNMPLELP